MSPLGRTYNKIKYLNSGLATPAVVLVSCKIKHLRSGETKYRPIDIIRQFKTAGLTFCRSKERE